MTQKIVAANWKMKGNLKSSLDLLIELEIFIRASSLSGESIFIAPSFPYLLFASGRLLEAGIQLTAQDCSMFEEGAHTGEVSASMLKDVGCRAVILGHSERRFDHKETGDLLNQKVKAATKAGLRVIFCVGESAKEREDGKTIEIVLRQLTEVELPFDVIVAYEPVWAIGSGATPSVEEVESVHKAIKEIFQGPILYGGSVTGENVKDFFDSPLIEGVLVGGASLKEAEIKKILQFSQK